MRRQSQLFYWLPPLIWTLAIFVLSGDLGSTTHTLGLLKWLLSWIPYLTPEVIELINGYGRKLGHAAAYACLYFFWFRALLVTRYYGRGRAFLGAMVICLLVSSLDEGHQSFLSSRGGSLRDVALDLSGVGLGALFTLACWRPSAAAAPPPPVAAHPGARQ